VAKTFRHHPWRTAFKALLGIALTTAGFILHGYVREEAMIIASVVLFASGLMLTRYYGVQSGQLRSLALENLPYRLRHTGLAILLRLLLALAAAGSCVWIWVKASPEGWFRYVPMAGLVAAGLLTVHFFRELVIDTVADVKREE
jgi:hypothetical protein